jgi:hypothetical protein
MQLHRHKAAPYENLRLLDFVLDAVPNGTDFLRTAGDQCRKSMRNDKAIAYRPRICRVPHQINDPKNFPGENFFQFDFDVGIFKSLDCPNTALIDAFKIELLWTYT